MKKFLGLLLLVCYLFVGVNGLNESNNNTDPNTSLFNVSKVSENLNLENTGNKTLIIGIVLFLVLIFIIVLFIIFGKRSKHTEKSSVINEPYEKSVISETLKINKKISNSEKISKYLEENIENHSLEELKVALINSGYRKSEIEAYIYLNPRLEKKDYVSPKFESKPEIKLEKKSFIAEEPKVDFKEVVLKEYINKNIGFYGEEKLKSHLINNLGYDLSLVEKCFKER